MCFGNLRHCQKILKGCAEGQITAGLGFENAGLSDCGAVPEAVAGVKAADIPKASTMAVTNPISFPITVPPLPGV